MTPDELRSLADEATPGPWKVVAKLAAVYTPDGRRPICSTWNMGDDGARMYGANRDLIALAPDLARLCANLGEALAQIAALAENATEHYNDLGMADVACAALTKFSELNSGAEVPPESERT